MATTLRRTATLASPHSFSGYASTRTAVLGLVKILFLSLSQLSSASAAPLKRLLHVTEEEPPQDPDDPSLWIYFGTAVILVLLGGAFSGLTIA
jgi:metal transporter CNNM